MEKEHLKNFIKLCKKKPVSVIKLISEELNNKVGINQIATKYDIPVEQILAASKIAELSADSLEYIYNKYHDMKKKGGKGGKGSNVPNFGALATKTKNDVKANISNAENDAGVDGDTDTDANADANANGEDHPSKFEQTVENSLNMLNTNIINVDKKIIFLNSKINSTIEENTQAITKKISSIVEENSKEMNIELLKQIQEKIDELLEKINLNQSGGANNNICKCCDCAKDGYVFSEDDGKQDKCS